MADLQQFQQFMNFKSNYDCYVLLAISRKKDTPEITNKQEIVFREVVRKPEEFNRKYNKLKTLAENYEDEEGKKYPFYIYVTINSRNALKASTMLKGYIDKYMEHLIYGNDCSKQLKKLDGQFISCLMKPECKSDKKFIFDLDDKHKLGKVSEYLDNKNAEIKLISETRNGYHIVTEPFNIGDSTAEFEKLEIAKTFEIKKDGLLFLEYIEV